MWGVQENLVSLSSGSRLGRYQILERVGRGGMASVFRALDPGLDRDVAVKVLPSFQAEDPTFIDRFKQEAQSVARLNHPNIIQIYDFGEDKGFNFIVMEYAPGGILQNLLGRQTTLSEALPLISQIAEALDYAHMQGVVHRDIKPANIILDADGKPKIADFGLARLLEASSGLTRSDTVIGTPEYMSPEQALGKSADAKSDLYAFGVLVYQILLGQTPFRGDTPTATLMAHIHQQVPLPRTLDPNLDSHVESILLTALAKEPGDRYESPGQMTTALAGVAGEDVAVIDATPTLVEPAPSMPRPVAAPKADAGQEDAPPPAVAAVAREAPRKIRLADYCLVQDVEHARPSFSLSLLRKAPFALIDKKQHFTGLRGLLWRLTGVKRGPLNPNICTMCEYHFDSRKLSEVTILMVNSKDLASLVRDRGPETASAYVSEFFDMCSDIVVNHDGMAAREGAYGVRAFFNAPIRNIDHVDQAIAAATEIQLAARRLRTEETEGKGLRVGITLDTGLAYAGTLGSNDARDFTVLGDLVEIAEHLQEHVEAGGILVTEQVYQVIGGAYPNAQKRVLQIKGVSDPVISYSLS